jgi:uncharacterized membrane protein
VSSAHRRTGSRGDRGRSARRRVGAVLAGLTALLAAATPAIAQQREAALTATGTVTVTWQGDPARGCAPGALCDVTGSVVLPLDARGQILAPSGRGRLFAFLFDERSAVVRVRRRAAGPAGPACLDATGSSGFGGIQLALDAPRGGRVTVRLRSSGALTPARCAGPLAADVAPVLPRAGVAAAGLLREGRAVSLAGRRAFAAGPFTGEVASTVVLRVGAVRRRPEPRVRRVPPRRPPARRAGLVDTLRVRYAVRDVGGVLTSAFRGADTPACDLLDACGLAGETTLTPTPPERARTVVLTARATRRGRRRPTAAELLDRIRAGRLRPQVGFGRVAPVRLRSAVGRADAAAGCAEDGPLAELALRTERAGAPPGALTVTALATSRAGEASLRTRCPGPGIAGRRDLATGTVPVARLAARTLTVRLAATGTDDAPGYAVAPRSGALTLALARRSARVTTARRR